MKKGASAPFIVSLRLTVSLYGWLQRRDGWILEGPESCQRCRCVFAWTRSEWFFDGYEDQDGSPNACLMLPMAFLGHYFGVPWQPLHD